MAPPVVAVLAACVVRGIPSPADAAIRALETGLELSGVPRDTLPALRVGVFAAQDPDSWNGQEHTAVCDALGTSGTTVMVAPGRCGSAVALHLAANALRAFDVDLALVIGPAGNQVGAVVLSHEAHAAAEGWHVRSRLLASAVGALGQGRPPVELATERAGLEPGRQRYGVTLSNVADTVRAHQTGGALVVGHGISGATVAVHLVLSPPQPQSTPRAHVPFLGLSAASPEALRTLVVHTLDELATSRDLEGMAADATHRPVRAHRVAVSLDGGVPEVRAALHAWLDGGAHPTEVWLEPCEWPTLRHPRPYDSAQLAALWMRGLLRLPRVTAPLPGRRELPPTPGPMPGANVPASSGGVRVWRSTWSRWQPGAVVAHPALVVSRTQPVAAPLLGALAEPDRSVAWSDGSGGVPEGTVVQLAEDWSDVVALASAADRQRAPTRIVFVGTSPDVVGAAHWVAADLPHLFGGLVQCPFDAPSLGSLVTSVRGAHLRVDGTQPEFRAVLPVPDGLPKPEPLTVGTWLMGGELDPAMLELASTLMAEGHALLLCTDGPPEPALLQRARRLCNHGGACTVVRSSNLDRAPGTLAGVIVRVSAGPRFGHVRSVPNPQPIEQLHQRLARFGGLAADVPMWVWVEGRALVPAPGTGITAVMGAIVDDWSRHRTGPTTVIHTAVTQGAPWVRRLGPHPGVHGVWAE